MGRSRASRQSEHQPSQPFFWQGLLILLPLLILAAAGVWSLRGQRQVIEQQAREDAESTALVFATTARQGIEQALRTAHPPIPLGPDREVGSRPFPFLYDPNPLPPTELELVPFGRYLDALDDPLALDQILTEHPNARSAAGAPLAVLILYQQWIAADPDERSRIRTRLEEAALHTHPSVLSKPILAALGSPALADWQRTERVREVFREYIGSLRETRQSQ